MTAPAPRNRYRKGQTVDVQIADGWLGAAVVFVWNAVDTETNRRIYMYDVAGEVEGQRWEIKRVPELFLRLGGRPGSRRRVLRAHSVRRPD